MLSIDNSYQKSDDQISRYRNKNRTFRSAVFDVLDRYYFITY